MKIEKIKNKSGFTLIELVVVIAIVSTLAVTALALLNPFAQFQKANDARRKSDLSQIQKALESYYQDKGVYPISASSPFQLPVAWGLSWQPYMNVLPKDPLSSQHYVYSSSGGQYYYLYASLERGNKDSQVCNSNGSICANVPAGASCGGTCNYGVSSPDKNP